MRWCPVVAVLVVAASPALAQKPRPIHVAYDAAHLDLAGHVLQFKPSRAIESATLTVITDDGGSTGTVVPYDQPNAGQWTPITWTQPADTHVMVLRLRVVAADGVATNVELIPWSVTIEHDDVNFRTDSADIDPDERAKLDASVAKIAGVIATASKYMKLTLYIAGHTDTVGGADANRVLSRNRAIAIGNYFRSRQLAVAIVVAGFGEAVLKVPTPDNTDERANRRADYVLGPTGGAPPFSSAYARTKIAFAPLR